MTEAERMDKVLHILNGDMALKALEEAGIEGERLVWREIYTAGPLSANLFDEEAGKARALWLEEVYGIPSADYLLGCARQRQKAIDAAEEGRPLAVWLDPDLFDQAIFMALSSLLFRSSGLQLFLVPLPPTPCNAEQMRESWPRKREIIFAELEAGARAWEAYCSLSPERIERLLHSESKLLPETAEALRFHLLRFPAEDGLGIVEKLTLLALSGDEMNGLPLVDLFRTVSEQVPLFGMGDLQFWRIVERLVSGPNAPLRAEYGGGTISALPKLGRDGDIREYSIKLEAFGREILEGDRKAGESVAEVHTFTGPGTF